MIGDLHCHTRLSDGSFGIDDVVYYGKRAGLDFIAITDHDTMAGITRAEVLGKRLGLHVIPGVELSAWDYGRGRKVHILCYMPQNPDRLEGLCARTLEVRNRVNREMMAKAAKIYPFVPEHVAKYSQSSKALYTAHILHAIMDLGYEKEIYGEAYRRLFDPKTGSCYVAREYADVFDVLGLVRDSGGISALAHPVAYNSIELLEELGEKKLIDGVEVYHKHSTPEARMVMEGIAKKYSLIMFGGSDFHGFYTSSPQPLGSYITPKVSIDALYRRQK